MCCFIIVCLAVSRPLCVFVLLHANAHICHVKSQPKCYVKINHAPEPLPLKTTHSTAAYAPAYHLATFSLNMPKVKLPIPSDSLSNALHRALTRCSLYLSLSLYLQITRLSLSLSTSQSAHFIHWLLGHITQINSEIALLISRTKNLITSAGTQTQDISHSLLNMALEIDSFAIMLKLLEKNLCRKFFSS